MSRFSEALVLHRRKTLSVEKERLYAGPFLCLPPASRPQFRRKPATAGLDALPLPFKLLVSSEESWTTSVGVATALQENSANSRSTSSMPWQGLPAGGALKLTAKTKARSKLLWGGQRMEAAWKSGEQNPRGQTAVWKKVSKNHSHRKRTLKAQNDSTARFRF